MTAAPILLLFCLPHLLARSTLDATVEALLNMTETTSSPDVKSGTYTDPLPSSLLATANYPDMSADGKLKPQETLTTSSGVFSTSDNHSQGNNKQPGGHIYSGQATTGQLSPVKTGINETHRSLGNKNTNGDVTTRADNAMTSDDNKASTEVPPLGRQTPPLYPNAVRTIVDTTFAPIQINNQTSSNNNMTLDNKHAGGSSSTSPRCDDSNGGSWSPLSPRLVCFIALWALGVTAAVFLGLTVCLWVRLSVQRERDRRGSARQRGVAKKLDLENLWVTHKSSVEERVEFWYANGTTLGHGHAGGRERQRENRSERGREKGREGEKENLWMQPKVTIKDITDFWYSNGRVVPEESRHQT